MVTLSLALLGRPQILIGDRLVEMKSQKAQALLYYLAMSRQIHSRQGLAGLLWSDLDEVSARRNLRVELLKLRAAVESYLVTSRETIGLDRKSDYGLDVDRFEHCLHGHEPTFAELLEAVELYKGEFLEDFHIRDAPLFEEWVTSERERLSQMARQATLRLVEHYIHQAAYDRGIEWVNLLLKREPWLEEAHQQQMRLLALNGQRSAALAHYEVASRILDDEFGVPPSDETNALYDQIESGVFEREHAPMTARIPTSSPSLPATRTPPPFQAPAAQLHFVGREEELTALQAQLIDPVTRPAALALVGMAGIGKTTLIAQLAHLLRDHFVDGVLWAYLGESEPLDILGSWAQALGYDFSNLSDVENRAAALRGVLVHKQILFLLDDVRSVARVRPLLLGGDTSTMLLTTRDLDVAMAIHAQTYAVGEMTLDDGTQLLTRILGEERVTPEKDAARQICRLLQNLPLAVEIAAQRLRSRPRRRLADMAARLQGTQERLDLAISDRAVRTSFLVSWESLDSAQQQAFALLGLFDGRSFAAPALAYIADLDLYTTEDRLFTLTALSLLNEEESAETPTVRYRQHPLLADFAREQLGEDSAMAQRLTQYYLRFAQAQRTNYLALQPEWENMMVALQTAHKLAEWQVVLDYANALTEPWFTRARYTEARQAYALASKAAEATNNEIFLAESLLSWGRACIEQDDYNEAHSLLTQALQRFSQRADPNGCANAKYYLARIALDRAQYDDAEALLEESLELYHAAANPSGISASTYQKALLAYRRGYVGVAKALCLWAKEAQEKNDDVVSLLPTLRLLIDIALEEQDFDAANQYCTRALDLSNEIHDRGELAATYYSLTVNARLQQEYQRAQSYAEEALALFELMGDRGFQALMYYELSRIVAGAHSLTESIELGLKSMQMFEELSEDFNLVYVLQHLGSLYAELDERDQATTLWQRALAIALAKEHPLTQSIQENLAQVTP